MRTTEQIIQAEVHYCVSSLVSTLASHSYTEHGTLLELMEQACELCAPIADYEEAARQAGWNGRTTEGTFWNSFDNETLDDCETYQDVCEELDIEPYEREVFEHWIVSDWLADKLEAKGEKVDRDFGGMIVWARTTTGQAISMDSVIEAIRADLIREYGE